ncbi:MAG TPA: HIT domain-containing protein [Lacipirellulaceae bacterium]|nr:HIT domain-containing protein [Lacipirellulaceae bacterium]
MSFERLWAPWRLEYVIGDDSNAPSPPEPKEWRPRSDQKCFLCRGAATYGDDRQVDRLLHVVARGAQTIVVLNRFPYNNGHLLISPMRHVGELSELTRDEHLECMELLARLTTIYRQQLNAEGFNVGLNLGKVAGAGVPGHLHWHLVPRWAGDNNFMPVLAGTRVIPQSLDALWELLTSKVPK